MEKVRIENVEHLQNLRNELSLYQEQFFKLVKLLRKTVFAEMAEEIKDDDIFFQIEDENLNKAIEEAKWVINLFMTYSVIVLLADFINSVSKGFLNFRNYIDMQLPPQIITNKEFWDYLKQMSPEDQRIAFQKILEKIPFDADDLMEAIESGSLDKYIEFMKKNFSELSKEEMETINRVKTNTKFYQLTIEFTSRNITNEKNSPEEIINSFKMLADTTGFPEFKKLYNIFLEIFFYFKNDPEPDSETLKLIIKRHREIPEILYKMIVEVDEVKRLFEAFCRRRFMEKPIYREAFLEFKKTILSQDEEPSQTPVLLENPTPAPNIPQPKALPQPKAVNEDSDLIPKITSTLPFPTAIKSEKWGNKQKKVFMWGIIDELVKNKFIAEDSEESFWQYFWNPKSTNHTCKKIVWEKDKQDLQYLIISLYKEADRRKEEKERFNYWSDVQNIFKRSRKDKNGCLSFKELSNNSPLFKMIEDGKYKEQAIIDGIIEKAKKEANKKKK